MAHKKRKLAWKPMRDFAKRQGANLMARDAVDVLVANAEERSKAIMEQARDFAEHRKSKTVTRDDVLLAIKYVD